MTSWRSHRKLMVKLGISVPPHLSFCHKTCAHQWLRLSVQGTGPQSLHHLLHSLQHLVADLHNQQKLGGGFPCRASLGVHSNKQQDLGGLAASICRPSKAEKKPQKYKTPSLCQMWFLNTGAQQADWQIRKPPDSRRVVQVSVVMPKC